MSVEPGLSHQSVWEQNAEGSICIWGGKQHEAVENCIMRTFTILYPSPNIVRVIRSKRMRCLEHESCMGEKRNAYKVFVRKSEEEIIGSSRHRRNDNIRVRDSHENFAPMLCWFDVEWSLNLYEECSLEGLLIGLHQVSESFFTHCEPIYEQIHLLKNFFFFVLPKYQCWIFFWFLMKKYPLFVEFLSFRTYGAVIHCCKMDAKRPWSVLLWPITGRHQGWSVNKEQPSDT